MRPTSTHNLRPSPPPHRRPSPRARRALHCWCLCLLLLLALLVPLSSCLSTHSPPAKLPSSSDEPPPSALARYSQPSVASPAGLLFVSTLDGQLHAVDAQNGNYLWAFGTGESLLRSQPATSVVGAPESQSAADVGDWDVMRGVEDEEDRMEREQYGHINGGAAADDSRPTDVDVDHLIIPGLNGQLFFSTRAGQLQRLPVTVNELVAASPFKSADDRMYVGRKSSAFILLERRTGKVKRVLNEYGERVYHTGGDSGLDSGSEGDSEEEAVDESELIWIGRQDQSVHAYHATQGKRWNVSLSEYFSHLDGATATRVWSEEQLQSIGLPHLAATVDGELFAIKDVQNRDRYQWRQAFSSPISSVHFSRDPSTLSSAASLSAPSQLDLLLPTSQLVKLPVYYLQPPSQQRGDGVSQMSLVDQYLYVRMKAVKTKTVDTYVGQTKEGVLYALPNPPTRDDELNVLPPEQDFLLGYQPPVESDRAVVRAAAAGGSSAACPVGHPYWPHCMIGLHSITDASMLSTTGVYVGLPGLPPLPIPAILNVSVPPSRESDYPHFARDDTAAGAGGTADGWLKLLVTINLLLVAAVVAYIAYDKMNSSKKKRKKKEKNPQETRGSDSAAPAPVKTSVAPDTTVITPSDTDTPAGSHTNTQKEPDEEKKELHDSPTASPPSSGQLIVPTDTSPSSLHPRLSSTSSSSSISSASHSTSSPTNSDGSLAIPSTSLGSVFSSLSKTYSIGKIQIFADQVLGTGSMGTVVYAGLHETRECAVKRLVKPFFGHDNADKEISLLIQSDQHPNVLRYYAKEEDASFIYIALEKCAGSLQDLIDRPANHPAADRLLILHSMMTGLAHLHSLNIVHRDLKPANILLTTGNRCKLADMGLGKQLDLMRSSFDSVVSGSFGWQPAEVLNVGGGGAAAFAMGSSGSGGRLTKAVDVFSAGCVVHYVLSGGHHPFGLNVEREINIVRGQPTFDRLRSHRCEAIDLVSSMIAHSPDDRLSASDCVHHPLFWSDEQKLHFLLDVSDRVEAEPEYSECRLTLEKAAASFLNPVCSTGGPSAGWDVRLYRGLLDNLGKFRKYDFTSCRDLLRVIRNKRHHYRDLPEEVQRELGGVPSGFLAYFTDRFPELLMCMYRVMACFCVERDGHTGSVCPLDDMKDEDKLNMALPLVSYPSISLTAQFRPYYANVSLKRLCQLQDDVRLRYRVWSNEDDQWAREDVNLMLKRGAVLARGFARRLERSMDESEKRVKEEQKEDSRAQRASGVHYVSPISTSTAASSRHPPTSFSPSHRSPSGFSYSKLPPSASGPPSIFSIPLSPPSHAASISAATSQRAVTNGHTHAPASQPVESTTAAFPPLSSAAAVPAAVRAQSDDSPAAGKSYSTALFSPPANDSGSSSQSAASATSSGAQPNLNSSPLYQHLLRLPKRPGIKTLSPLGSS